MSIVVGFQSAATSDGRRQFDGATAILIDGGIYSLPEAYLSRRKHDGNVQLSLAELLRHFRLSLHDVDHFCVSTCGEVSPSPSGVAYLRTDQRLSLQDLGVPNEKISWVQSHHYSHALEGLLSLATLVGWDEVKNKKWAVFVGDRVGQPGEHQTLFRVIDGYVQVGWQDTLSYSAAPGFCHLYDDLAQYLGYTLFDAGKVMALGTAYTGTAESREIFSFEDAQLQLREEYRGPDSRAIFSKILGSQSSEKPRFQDALHVSASLQTSIEKLLPIIVQHGMMCEFDGIVVTGGIGQNCHLVTAVSQKLSKLAIGGICAGDVGQGIGNILNYFCPDGNLNGVRDFPSLHFLRRSSLGYIASGNEVVGVSQAAEIISKGGVILALGDQVEPGPRALGYHSILADARSSQSRKMVSEFMKGRESFRPLGAIVHDGLLTQEEASLQPSAFMDTVIFPGAEFLNNYPAVTHVDGSVRIQRISKVTQNSAIEELMTKLVRDYDIHAIVNTSLNKAGQPLDITGAEADYSPGKFWFV